MCKSQSPVRSPIEHELEKSEGQQTKDQDKGLVFNAASEPNNLLQITICVAPHTCVLIIMKATILLHSIEIELKYVMMGVHYIKKHSVRLVDLPIAQFLFVPAHILS